MIDSSEEQLYAQAMQSLEQGEKNPISMPRKQPTSCNITDNLSRFRQLSNVFWRFLSQQMTQKRVNT